MCVACQPVRPTTIRWPDGIHAGIEQMARAEGVSFAQFVREAALMRWAFTRGMAAVGNGEAVLWDAALAEARQAISEFELDDAARSTRA